MERFCRDPGPTAGRRNHRAPVTAARLDKNDPGWEDLIDGAPVDYDYGGSPDVVIDITRYGNYADDELDIYLNQQRKSK